MTKLQPEKKLVINPIMKKLECYQMTGDVLWFQRLVAEDDIHCPAGTPDIFATVDCMNGKIAQLFIECKKPVKRAPSRDDLRFEQRLFFEKMDGKPMTLCVVINNPSQLWMAIKKAQNL